MDDKTLQKEVKKELKRQKKKKVSRLPGVHCNRNYHCRGFIRNRKI